MKKILFIIALIVLGSIGYSQKLYMPREFKKAYKNETRTEKGVPGKNYFTNWSEYKISAEFNIINGNLTGNEDIILHNESPDTIKKMTIRLYQNIFKKGSPRDIPRKPEEITDGVKLKKVIIDGIEYSDKQLVISGSVLRIKLKKTILPHSTATLHVEWQTQIPQQSSLRFGKYGKNNYLIAYWYPQIAVYDDIFGWDTNIYTGVEEFYNEHSNYDVSITVDNNAVIWATGLLQNGDEIFTEKITERIKKAKKSDEVVNVITKNDREKKSVLKKSKNTWHFKATKVPDFAFAVSDNFLWDAVSLSLQNKTERVFISAVYPDTATLFKKNAKLARDIIQYFSEEVPGYPFPYPSMTIFNGGGGMEYPMMVNESEFGSEMANVYVTAHEIGHSYFPFFTGTNETVYAWMDEGLMSFFPRIASAHLMNSSGITDQILKSYESYGGTFYDIPQMTPSSFFKDWRSYRNIAYNRPAFAFYMLADYLGQDLFFKALQEYIDRWKYKHPYPYDFFNTFNNVVGQDLSWFWRPYFFEYAYADLAIEKANFSNNKLNVKLRNKGGLPVPVRITVLCDDDTKKVVEKKADCWKKSDLLSIEIKCEKKPVRIKIGGTNIPDLDKTNNVKNL